MKCHSTEPIVSELILISDIEQRIDIVARDFDEGADRFAKIDDWTLGELLGLDFDEHSDWGLSFLAYRRRLEDDFERPFAENFQLLEKHVSPKRFQELGCASEKIIAEGSCKDIELSKQEVELLSDIYAQDSAESAWPDLVLATTTILSSDGIELGFEVCIGDGGEAFDAISPYGLRDGRSLKRSDYLEIENSI